MKKIIISVLALIVVIIGAFAIWQWDNICAVVEGIRYDEEEIAQKSVAAEHKIDEYFEKNNLGKITPMTLEQEQALQNGEITPEAAVKIMTGAISFEQAKENTAALGVTDSLTEQSVEVSDKSMDIPPENKTADNKSQTQANDVQEKNIPEPETENVSESVPQDNSEQMEKITLESSSQAPSVESEPESSGTDYDSLISEKVAELYVVKSNFYASFNSKYSAARSAFLALPKSERTKANLAATVKSYVPEGLAMERECDSQVEAILSELKVLLKQAGRDESLVEFIRSAYDSEKSAMKSSLISKYF